MGKKKDEMKSAESDNTEVKTTEVAAADEKGASKGKSKAKKAEGDVGAGGKLSDKAYARELKKLHVELVKLQQWVVHKGLKVCILFEGRDGAGKAERDGVRQVPPGPADDGSVAAPGDGASAAGAHQRHGLRALGASNPQVQVGRTGFELVGGVQQQAPVADLEPLEDTAAGEPRSHPRPAAHAAGHGRFTFGSDAVGEGQGQEITPAPNSSIPISGLMVD